MAESRNYCVADFRFSITAESEQLALLTNYDPFVETDTVCDQLRQDTFLFALTLGAVGDTESKDHVFTDSSDDDMPRIEVYRLPSSVSAGTCSESDCRDWLFQVSLYKASPTCARIRATYDFRQVTLEIADSKNTKFAIDNAAMLMYAFTTAKRGALEMHASVTVKDERGFLFLGRSGTGKSTHSQLWMEAFDDARLLNDDNPILRLLPDKQVRVYGSPWSGKTPCYVNRNVAVGGIVKLSQAPYNKIRQLRLPEAYAYMLSSASGLKIVPEMMDALYETIAAIIQIIPLHGLECLPDTDAARLCEQTVNRH